ncbi:MAG TPA: hypothetical protein VND15_04270 [Candidatus Acidoferrales bacterium]|nr:hypothetical protein [Candidatus Acidoferrales bacterium]
MAHTEEVKRFPELNLMDKAMLLRGMRNPEYFKNEARPRLYKRCGNDPEMVHEMMLDLLHRDGKKISMLLGPFFAPPKKLNVRINGIDVVPFGTAAGMDKNGDALLVFQHIFGMQEPGTVVLNPREGNKRVRVATLDSELDLINAQGFPSMGLDYFAKNLAEYRRAGGNAKVYVSVCGLPVAEGNVIETAMKEMYEIITRLKSDADGFVWNPFSPNTAALKQLRVPEVFYETSRLMHELAPDKLRMVKLGPYEPDGKADAMKLVGKFIDGGGHGVVTTNTKMIQKEEIPQPSRAVWGYPTAGRSGAYLKEHRARSIRDIRIEFPDSVIFATGGIFTPDDAFDSFANGANGVQGYTPYAFFGVGLARTLMKGVEQKIEEHGLSSLSELQRTASDEMRKASSSA